MTRDEQLEQSIAKLKAKLAKQTQTRAKRRERTKARTKSVATKARRARWSAVGHLADDAGLFGWDDATLMALFTRLAALAETPNPVAVLDGLLQEDVRGRRAAETVRNCTELP